MPRPAPVIIHTRVVRLMNAPIDRARPASRSTCRILASASVDAGVASLVLCSVADQAAALTELHRVIRPGGELRFYEHVLAHNPKVARWQRRVDPIRTRMAGGCHLTRDTAAVITTAGFTIETHERFLFQPCWMSKLSAEHAPAAPAARPNPARADARPRGAPARPPRSRRWRWCPGHARQPRRQRRPVGLQSGLHASLRRRRTRDHSGVLPNRDRKARRARGRVCHRSIRRFRDA